MKFGTAPSVIYKESDQLWPADDLLAAYDSESWSFYLIVRVPEGVKPIRPLNAEIKLISQKNIVRTISMTGKYLEQLLISEEKVDLLIWNRFVGPKPLDIEDLRYTLQVEDAENARFEETLEISLSRYKQEAKLIFPVKGKCIVAVGHDYNEHHRWDRSQFAYDIFPLGPEGQLTRKARRRNKEWWGYGIPVIAPSAGVVTYARDDLPENERPGVLPSENHTELVADPISATAGNHTIIDHGNDEYSLLAHLKHGSVAVRKGDHVAKGQQVGLVGNSGRSGAPHLHYALRNAPAFICDGLPSRFENLKLLGLKGSMASPKRGLFLVAE